MREGKQRTEKGMSTGARDKLYEQSVGIRQGEK